MEFQEMLKMVARKNNTTPEEVYLEMKKAIDVAWTNRTPEVIAAQRRLGFGDEPPTPEEYVMKVSLDVRREMDEEELS